MALMIDKKDGLFFGETLLWEKLEEFLPNNVVVYNNREVKGKEYDFYVMIPNLGIVIIEVKGWLPNTITVNGVDDIIIDGYSSPQQSPKKQVRAYRFAVINEFKDLINESPLVMDLVCYPQISKDEYYKLRLDIISDEKLTILSDDLTDVDKFKEKIYGVLRSNIHIPHSKLNEDIYNFIRMKNETTFIPVVDVTNPKYYSKLRIIQDLCKNKIIEIVNEYMLGVKQIVFTQNKKCLNEIVDVLNQSFQIKNISSYKNDIKIGYTPMEHSKSAYVRLFNFDIFYINPEDYALKKDVEIIDGKDHESYLKLLEELAKLCPFNYQQYILEHSTTEKNILVKAGAGTGKTYSMISRVAFLCNKNKKSIINIVDDLVMVTFTNDAAVNMKKRLKQHFMNYFILTASSVYINLIEEINNANISTIHRFAIELLRKFSMSSGLSTDFNISSNEYVRDIYYTINVNEFYNKHIDYGDIEFNDIPVKVYEIKNKLKLIADKLSDQGVNVTKLSKKEIGESTEENIPYFYELVEYAISKSEKEYSNFLHERDSLELNECLILLKRIVESGNSIKGMKYKFIFIDEFQDTDDSQILLFKNLQKALGETLTSCKLFVVGDLKQSIYRFRGANLSAFDSIINNRKDEWEEYTLSTNYRSDKKLLEQFDLVFDRLGKNKYLPYGTNDRLIGVNDFKEQEVYSKQEIDPKDEEAFYDSFYKMVNNEVLSLKENKENNGKKIEGTIAILTRSNNQVDTIIEEGKRRGVTIETSSGGTLYQSQSTHDLHSLLYVLCNPRNPLALVNFIESNFINVQYNYNDIMGLSSNDKVNKLIDVINEYLLSISSYKWNDILDMMIEKPILVVIKELTNILEPWGNYSRNVYLQKNYIANYKLIIEKIISIRSEGITALIALNFLHTNIITSKKEETRDVSNSSNDNRIKILCTTIHKSKGLEYDVVILPFTSTYLEDGNKKSLEVHYTNNFFSNFVLFDNNIVEKNVNYDDDDEKSEQIMEETRILYVALTRAIQKFVWVKSKDSDSSITWANMLEVE